MLFNSFEFIFIFLPVVFTVYFLLNQRKLLVISKYWLVASSLFFYGWWNIAYLPLMLMSIFVNYGVGNLFNRLTSPTHRWQALTVGLLFNFGLLGYFKYADFFIMNTNRIFPTDIPLLQLLLPLAISFFTFQQVAYLIDAYRREIHHNTFLDYVLFVAFFPQLIAGPIVNHHEMMPQFARMRQKVLNYRHIALGMFIFSIGLFKKVAIADTFAVWANEGYQQTQALSFLEGWIVSLSYTFQLYFDFSGYTDMAIGVALLFNIQLPRNFNSPYQALNITDFWRRWHMTLTRFLTKYIYIPLGGNQQGTLRTYLNIFFVFVISGFWHGAGWTFVFWGILHGLATLIHRYWQTLHIHMNRYVAWFITFNFVNITWVFFRAQTWSEAWHILRAMSGLNGIGFAQITMGNLEFIQSLSYILIGLVLVLGFKNSTERMRGFKPTLWTMLISVGLTFYAITHFNQVSDFLYFNF